VIADDEPLARRGIRQMLAPHQDVTVVAEARTGRETVRALRAFKPDLLFLDVQMPELDGFEVLRAVGVGSMPAVVFVTAYDEFAVRAFDAHALDYLVKPLESARFAIAVERMRERLNSAQAIDLSRKLTALLATREQERSRQRIVVPTTKGELVLSSEEVAWIEADDYYAAVHARGGRYLVRESLASLAQRLDKARFLRVHRSAIVNLDEIAKVLHRDGDMILRLRDGTEVPVSRRRRAITMARVRRSNV
jgi:two-component system LytT family response regulator